MHLPKYTYNKHSYTFCLGRNQGLFNLASIWYSTINSLTTFFFMRKRCQIELHKLDVGLNTIKIFKVMHKQQLE